MRFWSDFLRLRLLDVSLTHSLSYARLSKLQIPGEKPSTIALLVVGACVLVAACVQETYTKKTRFIPPGIFAKTGASASSLYMTSSTAVTEWSFLSLVLSFGSFFQTFAFTSATFYLALFFQAVTGASAIQAGFLLLPFSLGSALISLVANLYIRKKGDPKHMVILGFGISALGYGKLHSLLEFSLFRVCLASS